MILSRRMHSMQMNEFYHHSTCRQLLMHNARAFEDVHRCLQFRLSSSSILASGSVSPVQQSHHNQAAQTLFWVWGPKLQAKDSNCYCATGTLAQLRAVAGKASSRKLEIGTGHKKNAGRNLLSPVAKTSQTENVFSGSLQLLQRRETVEQVLFLLNKVIRSRSDLHLSMTRQEGCLLKLSTLRQHLCLLAQLSYMIDHSQR